MWSWGTSQPCSMSMHPDLQSVTFQHGLTCDSSPYSLDSKGFLVFYFLLSAHQAFGLLRGSKSTKPSQIQRTGGGGIPVIGALCPQH